MSFMFENLEVYQKAITFADEISNLTEDFSKGNYYLVDQLNRAALSILAKRSPHVPANFKLGLKLQLSSKLAEQLSQVLLFYCSKGDLCRSYLN